MIQKTLLKVSLKSFITVKKCIFLTSVANKTKNKLLRNRHIHHPLKKSLSQPFIKFFYTQSNKQTGQTERKTNGKKDQQ